MNENYMNLRAQRYCADIEICLPDHVKKLLRKFNDKGPNALTEKEFNLLFNYLDVIYDMK